MQSLSSPIVSVILPVYNAEATLAETIDSILRQTHRDFEFLILNDGSTDESAAIMDAAADRDDRIRVWHQDNSGFAVSLNRLISYARGSYLARIDADDVALPERFELQVKHLQSHQETIVLGSAVISMDADGDDYGVYEVPLTHQQIESQMLDGRGGIIHPSVMMRRAAVEAVGGYSLHHPVCEDQELWLRLALIGRLTNLSTPLTKYRVHASNMSFVEMNQSALVLHQVLKRAKSQRTKNEQAKNEQVAAITSIEDFALREPVEIDEWERRRTWAWTAIASSNAGTARKHARRLVRERPWRINGWKLLVAAYRTNFD